METVCNDGLPVTEREGGSYDPPPFSRAMDYPDNTAQVISALPYKTSVEGKDDPPWGGRGKIIIHVGGKKRGGLPGVKGGPALPFHRIKEANGNWKDSPELRKMLGVLEVGDEAECEFSDPDRKQGRRESFYEEHVTKAKYSNRCCGENGFMAWKILDGFFEFDDPKVYPYGHNQRTLTRDFSRLKKGSSLELELLRFRKQPGSVQPVSSRG